MESRYEEISKLKNHIDPNKNVDWCGKDCKEQGYKPFMHNEKGEAFDCSIGKFVDWTSIEDIVSHRTQTTNMQAAMPGAWGGSIPEKNVYKYRVCKMAFNLKKAEFNPYSVITNVFEKPFGYLILIDIKERPEPIWIRAKTYARDENGRMYQQYYYDDQGYLRFTQDVLDKIQEKYSDAMKYVEYKREEEAETRRQQEEEKNKPVQTDLFDGQDLTKNDPRRFLYHSNKNWYKVAQESSTLICIDIQQEATDYIGFNYCELANFMSGYANVIYIVDENMAGGSIEPDLHPQVKEYYEESAGEDLDIEDYEDEDEYWQELDEAKYCSIPDHIDIKVKAFGGILRTAIDMGTEEEAINFFKNVLSGQKINIEEHMEFIESFMNEYGRGDLEESLDELKSMSSELISGIPNDFWKSLGRSIDICGGGVNECLREVQMALEILDIEYNTIGKFTYGKNKNLYKTSEPVRVNPYFIDKDDPEFYEKDGKWYQDIDLKSNDNLKEVVEDGVLPLYRTLWSGEIKDGVLDPKGREGDSVWFAQTEEGARNYGGTDRLIQYYLPVKKHYLVDDEGNKVLDTSKTSDPTEDSNIFGGIELPEGWRFSYKSQKHVISKNPIRMNDPNMRTISGNEKWYKMSSIPEGLRYEDPEEYGEQAYKLSEKYFNVLRNTELKAVIENEMDQVVAALFTDETNSDSFSFDVVVRPDYQRMGIGKDLVDYAVDTFNELKEVYGDDYYIDVHVINPNMQKLLEDHYGFEVDQNLNQSDVTMRYQENEKWYRFSEKENMKLIFKDDFPPEVDELIENKEWSILLTDSNIAKYDLDTEDIRKIVNIILMQEDTRKIIDILADVVRRKLITKKDPEYQDIKNVMDMFLNPDDWKRIKQMEIFEDNEKTANIDDEELPDSEMWDDELEGNIVSVKIVEDLKPRIAEVAQRIYDEWDQSGEDGDLEVGFGGICHIIAENIVDVLYGEYNIPVTTVSTQIGENHVFVVFAAEEGTFSLDISPSIYESGGGYNWEKIPDVKFDESHISIEKIDGDPKVFKEYVGE